MHKHERLVLTRSRELGERAEKSCFLLRHLAPVTLPSPPPRGSPCPTRQESLPRLNNGFAGPHGDTDMAFRDPTKVYRVSPSLLQQCLPGWGSEGAGVAIAKPLH